MAAVNGLVSGQDQAIGYSNLGRTDIRLKAGELFGWLEEWQDTLSSTGAQSFIAMESIFEGMAPFLDEEINNPPAGTLYTIHPTENKEPDVSNAHVLNHWGDET